MPTKTTPTPAMLRQRKTQKKGIKFTVMLCGAGGSGKSTFINTICQQEIVSLKEMRQNIARPENAHLDPGIQLKHLTVDLPDEGNGILSLKFIDTPGFDDNMNNMDPFNEIVNYIDKQFDEVLAQESRVKRNPRVADNRVHALIYFINPTSHGLREPDVEFMRMTAHKVNVIPVIAKSDSLTPEELTLNKKLIMEDIRRYKLCIYGFPGGDGFLYDEKMNRNSRMSFYSDDDTSSIVDEEFNELNSFIRTKLPFAVIGASETIDTGNGNKIQARRYPWGVLDVNDPKYSDIDLIRDIIIRTHLQDLKETTHFVLYENYRTQKLSIGLSNPDIEKDTSAAKANPYSATNGTNKGAADAGTRAAPNPSFLVSQQQSPYLQQPNGFGSTNAVNSIKSKNANEDNAASYLNREEQLRASEVKLRMVESQVQQEILQKRQELLAREHELKELEAKLKFEAAEMLKSNSNSPNPNTFNQNNNNNGVGNGYGFGNNNSRGPSGIIA